MSFTPDRRRVLAGLAMLPGFSMIGPLPARAEGARPLNAKVVMSGHSLTDPIDQPLITLVRAVGGESTRGMVIDRSTVPGSTMNYRWQPEEELDIDARRDIAKYDTLVLTERVPVRSAIDWEESMEYAVKWFGHAWKNGNGGQGAETVFYATWIDIGSGPGNTDEWDSEEKIIPFRERLELEMGSWQDVADHVNRTRPAGSPKMKVIPGPKIMAAVYDAIKAKAAPRLNKLSDLFEDRIHVNGKGGYLMAVAHLAVIYGRDPREIPALYGEEGWPQKDTMAWMHALVWDVLRAYPDSGLG